MTRSPDILVFSKNNGNRPVFRKNNGNSEVRFNNDNIELAKKSGKLKGQNLSKSQKLAN